LNVMVV